jgi:hypothetical protein
MTTGLPVEDFASVWTEFLEAIRRLLEAPMSEVKAAKFDHFRPWSDSLQTLLARPDRVGELQAAWDALHNDEATREAAEQILLELKAFTDYVTHSVGPIDLSAAVSRGGASTEPREDVKEGLGIAKTIVDSLKDMLDNLPATWKILLKGLSELLEIGKGFF